MEPDSDIREQIEAIQNALRRAGREMVLPAAQAFVRGLFVLAGCGWSYLLLGHPWWQMAVLWTAVVVLLAAAECALYLRLLARHPEKSVTGMERQMLKFLLLTFAVGLALSAALLGHSQGALIPGVWLLLIGAAYVTVGLFSFSQTWILGLCVCAGGAAGLFLTPPYSLALGGLTLGLGSILWAIVLRTRERRIDG